MLYSLIAVAALLGAANAQSRTARTAPRTSKDDILSKKDASEKECPYGHDGYLVILTERAVGEAKKRSGKSPAEHVAADNSIDDMTLPMSSVVHAFQTNAKSSKIKKLAEDPNVGSIEANCIVQLEAAIPEPGAGMKYNPSKAEMEAGWPAGALREVRKANENARNSRSLSSSVAMSWGQDRTDQANLPLDSDYITGGYEGSLSGSNEVRVYVLDTGVLPNHPEFLDSSLPGGTRILDGFSSGTSSGSTYWTTNGLITDPSMAHYHGTHCAGTVTGTDYGIARQTKVVAVQVLSSTGSGSYAGVIAGINWAANNATNEGVKGIISMSLGGGKSTSVNNAVDDAMNNWGVPSSCSAGNSNADAANSSPASATKAITVGATQNDDKMAHYTNWGPTVEIFAPGTAISAAWLHGGIQSLSGTSMSAPHVSGVLAALWAENDGLSAAQAVEKLYCIATPDVLSPHPNTPAGHNSPNLLLRGGSAVADDGECFDDPDDPTDPDPNPTYPPVPPEKNCGPFYFQQPGKACPTGYATLPGNFTAEACLEAAQELYDVPFVAGSLITLENRENRPEGCYRTKTAKRLFWNKNPESQTRKKRELLCRAAA